MTYPKNMNLTDQEHLLFDIGYSYALLVRCREHLKALSLKAPIVILQPASELNEMLQLILEIDALMAGRQQTTTEIYDAADKLFKELGQK